MPNNFKQNRVDEFLQAYHCSETDFRTLLSFIDAPSNLVRFQAVAINLLDLFNAHIEAELLQELQIDAMQIERWIRLLLDLRQKMFANIPDELHLIRVNGNKQIRGLIGEHPVYASLFAENLQYPSNHQDQTFSLHFVVVACANGYQKLIQSGEIKTPTGGISSGLLSIRKLSKEQIHFPDFRYENSLASMITVLDSWSERQQQEGEILWSQYLRLLFSSFNEQRESYRFSRKSSSSQSRKGTHSGKPFNYPKEGLLDAAGEQSTVHIDVIKEEISLAQRQELSEVGLHADEAGRDVTIFIADESAPDQAKTDYRATRQRSRGFIQTITQQAQHLPTAWSVPTPYESESLLRMLHENVSIKTLESLSTSELAEIKALMLLQFWTGRSSESLQQLIVLDNRQAYEDLGRSCLAFLLDRKRLVLPVRSAAKHNLHSQIDKTLLKQKPFSHTNISLQNSIEVKLPSNATNLLLAAVRAHRETRNNSNKFFRHTEHHKDWATELIKVVNKQYLTRWTEQRLTLVMRHAILECTGDQALLHKITEQEVGHGIVASHYQRTSVDYLQAVVQQVHLWLQEWVRFGLADYQSPSQLLSSLDGASVGSDLAVTDAFVQAQCEHYKHKIQYAKTAFFAAERTLHLHNALVAYIVSWLGFASGYRAVSDPLSNSCQLDRQTGILVISDKDDEFFSHSRLVFLPPKLVEQLDLYVKHLEQLALRLFAYPKLQAQVRSLCKGYLEPGQLSHEIPFLFLLTDKFETQRVSPKTLLDFNPTKIPINHNRHYLRSKLSSLQAPTELVDYFLGHWERGEEPYQKASSISPLDIAHGLAPYLKQIDSEISWTQQGGLAYV